MKGLLSKLAVEAGNFLTLPTSTLLRRPITSALLHGKMVFSTSQTDDLTFVLFLPPFDALMVSL